MTTDLAMMLSKSFCEEETRMKDVEPLLTARRGRLSAIE